MNAGPEAHPDELPAPDPALHLFACLFVALMPEMGPKARARVLRRMDALLDPTRPPVVHIRPRLQDRAVEEMRVKSAAYWRKVLPTLMRLVDLTV